MTSSLFFKSPKTGSFMDNHSGIGYLTDSTEKLIIGKVSRVARNRFKWTRYADPVSVSTVRKTEPQAAESHVVGRISTAIWALRISHNNTIKTTEETPANV